MEETPVTGHRKRDRRQAVLNSHLLKEIMDSSEEDESEKDDQEDERPKKRAHTAQKQARAGREGEKESTAKTKKQSKAAAAEKDLENESLIEIIKHKGKYVDVAAMQWLERYEANTVDGLNELLLTLFEACGVTLDLQEESYTELDVDDVVKEMLSQAKQNLQGAVEDYLGSKQKDVRNFKDNLLTFWDILVRESQEGPLFDQQLMEKCMDYVIALSCTPPRVFRHVATRIGLQLVTSFVAVAKTLGQARETAQRQLNAETKKRKEGARIESLNKQLSEKHEKITMVEEMMRRIFTGVFMHRYRDVDPEIRQACISAMGSWVVSYPSLFLQDLYLKYIGWTLNDKNPAVRKSSISALQALYAVDDHVPSLSLFTARFCNRMVEMADDVDMTVAVNAIGLLKQLLKHELLTDEDQLGSVYDLLIDEAPQIRHAVGDLVYEHMISRPSEGQEDEDLSGQLERLLRIVNAFSADSTLCDYVIDALWDRCQAMKDWKCMTTMLLEDPTQKELNDQDTNNLVRVLSASVKKAVGEKIVPSTEHRKPHSLNKAQKEAQETRKKDMTSAMVNSHAKLLRKYLADNTKVAAIVEIIMYMQLGHYSFMRQEQNFTTVLQLIKEAFFKHGDENTLKSCIKALAFAANESQADLQDSANQILKETADDLLVKVRSAITRAGDAEDDYSLTVNLRRLYQLQLVVNVSNNLFTDLQGLLDEYSNLGDEIIRLVLLNMFLHLAWALRSIDLENPDDASIKELLAKRTTFMEHLQVVMDSLLDSWGQGTFRNMLTCTMCAMLSDLWSLFSKAKLAGTRLRALGFCPSKQLLQQFWKLCENHLAAPDGSEEEVTDEPQASEYLNEKDAVVSCAAKLIAHEMVPKEYLGPEILSHYVLHGKVVAETVKQLLVHIKKHSKLDELSSIYSDAMKRAYERHLEDVMRSDEDWTRSQSFVACKDLGNRLAGTFFGFQRKEFRPSILGIVRGGIAFAFTDAPKQLSFLETGVIQFALKLPSGDIKEVLAGVEQRVDGIDTDADPNGWRPYFTFVEGLREKIARTEPDNGVTGRPPRTGRKKRDLKGKRLFENPETSSGEEDSPPPSESEEAIEEDDDDDDDTPLFQVRQTMRRSALPARGSQLRPPPVPKVLVADTRKPIEQATPSFVDTPEEEEEEEKGDSPGTLERGSLSSDDPIMMGSATEEQLPAYPRGAAQDSSVTYSSTEETRQTGNNVRSKRPVSFSSDEEEDLNMEKRTRRDQDTDSMDT